MMSDDMTSRLDDIKEEEPQVVERSPKKRFVRFNRKLGCGSYKTVYLGFDNDTGREVAWNVITFKHMSKQERKRIREEIDIVKSLDHNRIITFINTWINKQEEEVVFISERVTGGSLRSYINRLGAPLKIKVVRDWSRQILEGLRYLHTHVPSPVIHRDLKCDNIFINGNVGEILIGDLGLSTVLTESCAASVVGTPEFMAPEYYEEKYGTSVDIYAFGMCVLEMVVRTSPYSECSTLGQIYKKVIAGEKPLALARVKDQQLRDLIRLCLVTRADDRPTAEELLYDQFLVSEDGGDRLCELWDEDEIPWPLVEPIAHPPSEGLEKSQANVRNGGEQHYTGQTVPLGGPSGSGEVFRETHRAEVNTNARNRSVLVEQCQDATNCSNRAAFDAIITRLKRKVVASVHLLVHQPDDGTFHRVVFDYDTTQDSPDLVAKEMIEGGIVPPTIILQDLINRIEEAVTLRAHELLLEDAVGFESLPNGGASSPSHAGGMPHAFNHDEVVPVINCSGQRSSQDAKPKDGQYIGPCEVQTVILKPGLQQGQQVAVQTVLMSHDASPVETSTVQMARHDLSPAPADCVYDTTLESAPPVTHRSTTDSRIAPTYDASYTTDPILEEPQFTCPAMRQRVCLQRGDCTTEMSEQIVELQRCLNFLVRVKMEDVVTGQFCPATEAAAISFQKSHALSPTGIVDCAFWDVLRVEVQQKQKVMQMNRDLAKEKASKEKERKKEQQDRDSALQLANMMSDCFESLGSKNPGGKSGEMRRVASTTMCSVALAPSPDSAAMSAVPSGTSGEIVASSTTAVAAAPIIAPCATPLPHSAPLIAPSSTAPMSISSASAPATTAIDRSTSAPIASTVAPVLQATASAASSTPVPNVGPTAVDTAGAPSVVLADVVFPPAPAVSSTQAPTLAPSTAVPAVGSATAPAAALSPAIHAPAPSSPRAPVSATAPIPAMAPPVTLATMQTLRSSTSATIPAPSSPRANAVSAAPLSTISPPTATPAIVSPTAPAHMVVSPATILAPCSPRAPATVAASAPAASSAASAVASTIPLATTHAVAPSSAFSLLDASDVAHGHAAHPDPPMAPVPQHAQDTPGHRSVLSRRQSPSSSRSRPVSPEDPDSAHLANRSAS